MTRLAGFIIHGNNAQTLPAALASLRRVCDVLVCVDSGSTDGSLQLSRAVADEVVVLPWQGYGAARARAVEVLRQRLGPQDWCLSLDSDEQLPDAEGDRLLSLLPGLDGRAYRLSCRNWSHLPPRPYLFSTFGRVRLFRLEAAPWQPSQIVHEAFPRGRYPLLPVSFDHRFLEDEPQRERKQHVYALLWALQHVDTKRRVAPPWLAFAAQVVRELLSRGAVWRGGWRAVQAAVMLSRYSGLKSQYLTACRHGAYPELVAAWRAGDLPCLFAGVPAAVNGPVLPSGQ